MSAVAIGSVVVSVLLAAGDPAEATRPDVVVERNGAALHVDVQVPGKLLGYAMPRDGSGGREVYLLVADPEPPDGEAAAPVGLRDSAPSLPPCPDPERRTGSGSALYHLDPNEGVLDRRRTDLPSDATILDAADLDGDGRDELLLYRSSGLWRIDPQPSAAPVLLLELPGLDATGLRARTTDRVHRGGRPWIASADLGGLSLYGPTESAARWDRLASFELPIDADVSATEVRVWTRAPRELDRDSPGTLFFATDPETSGSTRVHTTLVSLDAAGGASVTDCWGRLPEPEDVLESAFLFVDDRPVLFVATKPANKLSLFGEKRLRMYPLERDRSRLGLLPRFVAESKMNVWQEGIPRMHDVNADGRADLVIGYWKGILGDQVVLDAYLRAADGAFETRARSTEIEVKHGDRAFVSYGDDLTGDGLADLLVRGKPGLLIFPGRGSRNGKDLVERRPVVVARSTDDSGGAPRLIDLDGDGIREILFVQAAGGRVHLVRIGAGAGD